MIVNWLRGVLLVAAVLAAPHATMAQAPAPPGLAVTQPLPLEIGATRTFRSAARALR